LLPEKTEETQDWKKNFPEEHDFPQIVEVKKFADASQSLKDQKKH
jgi:chromatin segregation and condensation protein Rec8/ScpA/Scc1 (kleisin family)